MKKTLLLFSRELFHNNGAAERVEDILAIGMDNETIGNFAVETDGREKFKGSNIGHGC